MSESRPPEFRRPESVLVVIHTTALECLLLERVVPAGVWQSVTGSLEWGETPAEAAVREVIEETGLDPQGPSDAHRSHGRQRPRGSRNGLRDSGIVRRFEIWPEWRHKFGPGVTENTEYLWYLELPERAPVILNDQEHRAYGWFDLAEAIQHVASWTNREALERLSPSLSLRLRR
jgi:dATP pyrophosphohydrolase